MEKDNQTKTLSSVLKRIQESYFIEQFFKASADFNAQFISDMDNARNIEPFAVNYVVSKPVKQTHVPHNESYVIDRSVSNRMKRVYCNKR